VSNIVTTDQGVYLDSIQKKGDDITATAAVITDQGAVVVTGSGKVAADQPALPALPAAPDAAVASDAAPAAADAAQK